MAELGNGWIDVRDRLPPIGRDEFTVEVNVLVEVPDGDILWRDIYAGYQTVETDEEGREIRTWFTFMDGNCDRVGRHTSRHYPHGKGAIFKTGARVIAWQPFPDFPDKYPHFERVSTDT